MTITGAIVLFAVIWFLGLLVALPIGLRTQGEENDIVEGTPSSAPTNPNIKKKVIWVTIVTLILWVPLVWFISSGIMSVYDLDFYGRMDHNRQS